MEAEDRQSLALIKPPPSSSRSILEILAELRAKDVHVTLDPDFGKDMEEIIARRDNSEWQYSD